MLSGNTINKLGAYADFFSSFPYTSFQYILDAYRDRRQIEESGGNYDYPTDGPMDDESFRIFSEAKGETSSASSSTDLPVTTASGRAR